MRFGSCAKGLRKRGWSGLALIGVAGCAAVLTGCATGEARLTSAQRELNRKSFDVVWETIRDKHFDPNFGGVDWEAVRTELRPKVEQAETMSAARRHMSGALERLELSHFGIIPSTVYSKLSSGERKGDGQTGLQVRVLDGAAIVVQVLPASPAEAAGVRPGWEVVQVSGRELAPLIAAGLEEYGESTSAGLQLAQAVAHRISGPRGEPVEIVFRDGADALVTLKLERVAPAGTPVQFGNLPTTYVRFDRRELPGGAGYFAFSYFFDPGRIMPLVEEAIVANMEAPGIVIDLRGNPGGIGAMAMGVAGWFVDAGERPLGVMRMRGTDLRFAIYPRAKTYAGKLAILVDGCTASTSEILAGGMQALGRARVFGTRTAGAALPSQIHKLPNGDGFQFAFADYVAADGKRLEGEGVTPDVEIAPTRATLLAGRDVELEAALQWIAASE